MNSSTCVPSWQDRNQARHVSPSSVTWKTKPKPLSFCYTPLCWLLYWQTFGGEVWTRGGTHYPFTATSRTQCLVASSLLQQGWRHEKKPWLCLQKHRNKNGDNSRKKGTDSSVNCAGCTLDGLSFWLSSYTQPLSTAHQPGTALHKRHSTASRPELTLLSAPLEHQRGDFATIISSEFTWKMSHTIQGSAELCWSQKKHFLKKASCSLNIWLLKCVSKYWNINEFILAVVTNIHSNKTSLFIYYRPISRSGHMS